MVLLSIDGARFHAHSAYLAAASVFFENMFMDARQPERPEIVMAERASLLDCLLCHSYASLTWSLDKTDSSTCVELMATADKFGHPRMMSSVISRYTALVMEK